MFTSEIINQIEFYVYRLIDPRNGETFYVGKGRGNRVFEHARAEIVENEAETDKLRRIREIRLAGFEVAHVIHRHGLDNTTALEVEAALMDAFPATANIAAGIDSGSRGVMHAQEIIEKYSAEEALIQHTMIAISINHSSEEKSPYEAVRYAWKLDRTKVQKAEYVLAVVKGLIVGVFVPYRWLDATPENFPGTPGPRKGRIGFVGSEAPTEIQALYMRKRLPEKFRRRGAANPVRYLSPVS